MLFTWIWSTRQRALPRQFATLVAGHCVSAASCAIGCSENRRRISISRSSAFRRTRLLPLLRTLGRVEPVGQAFPVYKLGAIDVALPRRESKTGRGHKGFTVEGDPSMSFEEAARRRDFTINAIGWDPLTDEYLDPFQGRKDLDLRVLRLVDPATFADDSLRVLRALQFAARFELTIDPDTARICASIALDDLPAERIWGEFEKLLLQAERPSIGFALARELGVDPPAAARNGTALRLPAGSRMASGRQRLDSHADGDRQGKGAERRSRSSAPGHDHARRGLPRSRQAGDDRGDRRPREVTEPRSHGRRAGDEDPRSLQHQHARRIRRARAGAGPGHRTPAADGVLQGAGHGDRRRVSPAGAEGRPRIAGALRARRLPRPRRHVRLLGNGLVHRTSADRWASSTSRRRRFCWAGI